MILLDLASSGFKCHDEDVIESLGDSLKENKDKKPASVPSPTPAPAPAHAPTPARAPVPTTASVPAPAFAASTPAPAPSSAPQYDAEYDEQMSTKSEDEEENKKVESDPEELKSPISRRSDRNTTGDDRKEKSFLASAMRAELDENKKKKGK